MHQKGTIMGDVIDFEEEKSDRELIAALEEFEKYMPTPEELERRIDEVRDKYDFHYDVNEPEYLSKVQKILEQAFSEVVTAFRNYKPGSEFLRKQYFNKLRTYDTAQIFLSDYIDSRYEIADELIPELEERLKIVNSDYFDRTVEELKSDIETYIPVIKEIYQIVFSMLENNDERCDSLDMYLLKISSIDYHPFNAYPSAYKRDCDRKDQSE